jgi:uncharacterized protein
MRLYSGKLTIIADEIIRDLVAAGDIEVEEGAEARLDLEAVLKEYMRREREVSEIAKDRIQARGLGHSALGRAKSEVAKERGLPPADEAVPYLIDQILNMLFHSRNVAEIYASDMDIRRKVTTILKRHMDLDEELDRNVRAQIKNLEEGTSTFEIEYARVMAEMKRRKGLE